MINGIVGLMNSGKTLDMTLKLFLAYCKGKTIVSNYHLNFPHKRMNKDFIIWLSREEKNIRNVVFGFDELWLWLDCRRSQKNTVVTYFFNQSSKDDSEIYFTTQHMKQVDNRLRLNLHRITQCSRVLLVNGIFKPISEEQRFLTLEEQEQLYIKTVDFKRVTFGTITEMVPQQPKYIKAKPIFKLYDTRQKIIAQ